MKLGCLAAATLALAACGGGGATTGGGPERARFVLRMDTTDLHYLVWRGTIADGETIWLDADGREQARHPGIIVALRDRLWQLTETVESRQASGCAADGRPEPDAQIQAAVLELVSGDESYRLTDWYSDSYGVTGGSDASWVTGSLGRFVFVGSRERVVTCDGAERTTMRGHVNDLYRDDMYEDFLDAETEERAHHAAARALATAARQAGHDAGGAPDTYVGETRLGWKDGAPQLEHLFWTSCPGCTGGGWSTDAVSTWMPAIALPGALAEDAELPAPIRQALSASPGPVGVSWGLPNPRWQRVFTRK